MQLVLNGILFCFILSLCAFSFGIGLHLGYKKKIKPAPQELSTQEKERIERRKREDENFWNYDGNPQKTI